MGQRKVSDDTITILDISRSDDGHRGQYMLFLAELFDARRVGFSWRGALTRQPVLVSMIEESFGRYVVVAVLRAVLGRRTVGLLFRPRPALEGAGWRFATKRWVLRGLRALREVRTLTILPFSVEPGFAEIADGWIYDLQCWDLCGADGAGRPPQAAEEGALAAEMREVAAGRHICCAVGRQDPAKGFGQFAALFTGSAQLRAGLLFVSGGKVAPELTDAAEALAAAGGLVLNRFISDGELLDLYAAADLVWCVYLPQYDQASGILGRAMQLGLPVVVREGSLVERLCAIEGVAHIACGPATLPEALLVPLVRERVEDAFVRARRHRAISLKTLSEALGVAPRVPIGVALK